MIARQLGYDVVVLERRQHPRFTIGESLTPLANQTLRRIAKRYDLPCLIPISRFGTWREAYPHVTGGIKRGFSYFHHGPGTPFQTDARHASELLVAASRNDDVADTQWLRADVDAWFAEQTRQLGVPVAEQHEIRDATRENGTWSVSGYDGVRGGDWRLEADLIVQATGQEDTVFDDLTRNLSTSHGFLTRSGAVWTHFDGLPRFEAFLRESGIGTDDHPFHCDDAALHHVIEEGWIWQIRFWDGRTSVGLVARDLDALPGDGPAGRFREAVARYPSLDAFYAPGRLSAIPGRWFEKRCLQRRRMFAAAQGVVWLPHAFGFVDPLHSTGIAFSLVGIERLGVGLETACSTHGCLDEKWLGAYDDEVKRDIEHVDRLIAAAYRGMHNPDLFHAATMLYFAAATLAERRRPGEAGAGFLGSADRRFADVVDRALSTLERVPRGVGAGEVRSVVRAIEDDLRPFNHVGLFHPAVERMYIETAAPEADV